MPSCSDRNTEKVVVYTSLDQVFSEPVLQKFENESGIRVKIVYDVEATKTTGLVNRLIAEKTNPQADVFWNSEIARTILLQNKGILEPYISENAAAIPAHFKDSQGYWTGFAARARVLIYNTNMLNEEELPDSIFDFTQPKWKGKASLAYPLFGTTSTHAAALFVCLGDQRADQYFRDLKANNIIIVDGNSTSRDRVQDGELPIGFTDTDDANVALVNNKPVGVIYPDIGEDQIGTLLIPNTVCMIKGAPNPENAKKLIDYLLSREVESALAFAEGAQIPLRNGVDKPAHIPDYKDIKSMEVNFEKVAQKIEQVSRVLQEIFVR